MIKSPNLVALWRMEGNSNDASGNGNNGTDTSMTYSATAGKFGEGGNFNGSSSEITLSSNAYLNQTGNFSISLWCYPISVSNGPVIIQSGSQNTQVAGWTLSLTTTGAVRFYSGRNTGTTDGTDYQDVISTINLSLNTWYHLVALWDGSYLRIYINGVLNNSVAWTHAPVYATTTYSRIGCGNGSGTNIEFLDGYLDEVMIFNTALTQSEIQSLMLNFSPAEI